VSVQELLTKDADDASLAAYKSKLLGNVTAKYPSDPRQLIIDDVQLLAEHRSPVIIDPYDPHLRDKPITLKEGVSFKLVLRFYVQHELISGLKFILSIRRLKLEVERSEEMLGSFAPSDKLIVFPLPEETAPSGIFARGSYQAVGKLVDDDGKCHCEFQYAIEIKKNW